uniref:hypothetical protein n=1 Tax=Nocardioides salarius TaxID=374513 RepID=UPI0030FCBAC4
APTSAHQSHDDNESLRTVSSMQQHHDSIDEALRTLALAIADRLEVDAALDSTARATTTANWFTRPAEVWPPELADDLLLSAHGLLVGTGVNHTYLPCRYSVERIAVAAATRRRSLAS